VECAFAETGWLALGFGSLFPMCPTPLQCLAAPIVWIWRPLDIVRFETAGHGTFWHCVARERFYFDSKDDKAHVGEGRV
jgi:hypothetical protein